MKTYPCGCSFTNESWSACPLHYHAEELLIACKDCSAHAQKGKSGNALEMFSALGCIDAITRDAITAASQPPQWKAEEKTT